MRFFRLCLMFTTSNLVMQRIHGANSYVSCATAIQSDCHFMSHIIRYIHEHLNYLKGDCSFNIFDVQASTETGATSTRREEGWGNMKLLLVFVPGPLQPWVFLVMGSDYHKIWTDVITYINWYHHISYIYQICRTEQQLECLFKQSVDELEDSAQGCLSMSCYSNTVNCMLCHLLKIKPLTSQAFSAHLTDSKELQHASHDCCCIR